MESLRTKIWYIESDTRNGVSRGGGLCIRPTGLILTVASLVSPEMNAKSYEDPNLRHNIRLVHTSPNLGLALLQVEDAGEEEFDFLDLGETVNVDAGQKVFAYLNQFDLTFTEGSGYTCYPFPEDVDVGDFPGMYDGTTMQSAGLLDVDAEPDVEAHQPYRTVVSLSGPQAPNLHPRLPLVQVTGFFQEAAGMSGSPLFKCGSGEFIGLFSFYRFDYHFVIPLNFIRIFVDYFGPM